MKKNPNLKEAKFKIVDKESEKVTSATATAAYEGQTYDIMLHAWMGKFTSWLSPASLGLATFDWLAHLAMSPAKQLNMVRKGWRKCRDLRLTTRL